MKKLFVVAVAVIFYAVPSYAFEPNPGNRAYPIVGRDLVSGETISLEDYRGEWVLLEFWGYW